MRPLPDITDDKAMARLGRLSALRSARADVLHHLRDCSQRLLSGQHNDVEQIAEARVLLDRLEEIVGLEAREYGQ